MKLDDDQKALLMKTSLFGAVHQNTVEKVIASPFCKQKDFEKGELVYGRKEFYRSLGIVLEGSLRVTKDNADGHKMIMSTLNRGALFGAAALFNDEPEYATDIVALEKSTVLFFTQSLMQRMIRREPQIAENYIKYLSERILFLNKKIYFLTAGTAEQRLCTFLLDNMQEGTETKLPMPLNKLADALNISRASLYRAFDTLTADGAITKNGKTITVKNAEGLRKFMR